MARRLNPTSCYTLINAIAKQLNGTTAIQATDLSSFISVGETVLQNTKENILDAVTIVGIRSIMANRPYRSKFSIIREDDASLFNSRLRKISYYEEGALDSGDYNTDSKTNLKGGFDNGTNGGQSMPTMWEQHPRYALELNFGGVDTWQKALTQYANQLEIAFKDINEFSAFMTGVMTALQNEIETEKEAFARATMLNAIGGIYDLTTYGTKAIDLVALYNDEHDTSYTGDELRSGDAKESFYKWFVALVKDYSDMLEYKSTANHWDKTLTVGSDTLHLLRHTPKDKQKLVLFSKFFNDAQSEIMPSIFNPEYLKIDNFEKVPYWQSQTDRAKVSITPSIPDASGTNNGAQTSGSAVTLNYVVGMLFDTDAIMTSLIFDGANTTPIEARKRYYTTWYTFAKNGIVDFTENMVLFYMAS